MSAVPEKQNSGCFKIGLQVIVIILAFLLTVGIGLIGISLYTANQAVVKPIEALVRGIGLGATPEIRPDPITIVRQINDLARLETASYKAQKIISAEQGTDALFGILQEKLTFVAVGEVIAGVDLSKMQSADLQAATFQTVTIRIPPAELLVTKLDNQQSYIQDWEKGILKSHNPELETQVRQVAETQIRDAALADGILTKAQQNAQTVLTNFLKGVGFKAVVFAEGEIAPINPKDLELPKGFLLTPNP